MARFNLGQGRAIMRRFQRKRRMTSQTSGHASGRTAAQVLVRQLRIQGVTRVFCVPGESYLAVLDALKDSGIEIIICRNEGGAAMMAESHGKVTGLSLIHI